MHTNPPPSPDPFMDEVLSQERLEKDNEMGGNIPVGKFSLEGEGGGDFPRGSLMGGNFPGGDIPRRNFPRTYVI